MISDLSAIVGKVGFLGEPAPTFSTLIRVGGALFTLPIGGMVGVLPTAKAERGFKLDRGYIGIGDSLFQLFSVDDNASVQFVEIDSSLYFCQVAGLCFFDLGIGVLVVFAVPGCLCPHCFV